MTIPISCSVLLSSQTRKTVRELLYLGTDLDFVDNGPKDNEKVTNLTALSTSAQSSLVKSLDVFQYAMSIKNCRYEGGHVYEFEKRSTFTYSQR